ncbi:MAG: lipid A export permease/ATP-binding protein MsbA [Gammaproteobacteria bacterium]
MNGAPAPDSGHGKELSSAQLYRRLLGYALRYRSILLLAVLGTLVHGLSDIALAAILEPIVDKVMVEQDADWRLWAPLGLVGIYLVRLLAAYVGGVAMASVSNKIIVDLRADMFDRLLLLPSRFFDGHSTGKLISKITYDVNQVTTAATTVLVTLVKDGATVIGLILFLFYLNWQLTLMTIAALPPAMYVVKRISKRLRGNSSNLQEAMGNLTRVLEESISGQRVVKVFGGQDYERRRFHEVIQAIRRFEMKLAQAGAANGPLVQLIMIVPFAFMVYVAGGLAMDGSLTAGEFVAFFAAAGLLQPAVKRLADINPKLQRGLAAAESAFAVVDSPAEPDEGRLAPQRVRGSLMIRGLRFRYEGADHDALKDIELSVEPGQTVALVGQSGSGKTTLASLIPRFYDPSEGGIELDGVDLRDYGLAALRANMALVSQDVVLFNDTVAANIAYGPRADASRDEIVAAATAAHAMDFIERMPEGLDTVIGERGTRLSGGQRQRLAIARALLKDAPVLILDEATSALDRESELRVQQALETLQEGRTTLVIAHRLSTIEHADRIVVMDSGRVVESGSHAELIAAGGAYARLHALGFQEEVTE